MAGVERFELPTVGFGDRCSTNWNYTPAEALHYTQAKAKVKPLIKNLMLSAQNFNKRCEKLAIAGYIFGFIGGIHIAVGFTYRKKALFRRCKRWKVERAQAH